MKFAVVLIVTLALFAAACGQPPAGQATTEPREITSVTSSTSTSTPSTTATETASVPSSSTSSTTTSTVVVVVPGDVPEIDLLPPPPRDEIVLTTDGYFFFTEVSGASSYTGAHVQTYETEDDGSTITSEIFVDGERQRLSTDGEGELIEMILVNDGEGGLWAREAGGPWGPISGDTSLGWLISGVLNAAGPDRVYEFVYPVFDRLEFVGWEEDGDIVVARYAGDTHAAAALFGDEENAESYRDGSLEVWLDPRGFFTGYDVVIELEDSTYRVQWQLSDLDATEVEIPT